MRAIRPAVAARRAVLGPRLPSWTLEYETVAEVLRKTADLSNLLPIEVQRGQIDPPRPKTGPIQETDHEPVQIGHVPAEWVSQPGQDSARVIVYFHGGGYSTGSIHSHRDLLARLSIASGTRVLAPEYRRAPEDPYPAQLEDALVVYDWLIEQGIESSRIAFAGESAGAGIALSTMLKLREQGRAMPSAAALLSGWFDLDPRGGSMVRNRKYDFITRFSVRTMAKRVAPSGDHANPLLSQVHAELHELPPLLIQAGEAEALLDGSLRIAEGAQKRGVKVDLEVWPDMIHAWHTLAPLVAEGRAAIRRTGEFLKQKLTE